MQELQQQEQDLAGAHSVRREAAVPGAAGHEHRDEAVHEEGER